VYSVGRGRQRTAPLLIRSRDFSSHRQSKQVHGRHVFRFVEATGGAVRKKLSVSSSLVFETSPTTEMPVPGSAQTRLHKSCGV